MKAYEVVRALEDGKIIDDIHGVRFKYYGAMLYRDDGSGWLPTGLNVVGILQHPNLYRVVE